MSFLPIFRSGPFCHTSRMARPWVGLLLCLITLPFGRAQDAAPGTASTFIPVPGVGHDYIKALSETVDPASGSVSLRISVPTPKARGLTLPFNFAYDSNGIYVPFAFPSGNPPFYGPEGFATGLASPGGWSYTLPAAADSLAHYTASTGNQNVNCPYYTNFRFVDAQGGRHGLGLIYALLGQPCNINENTLSGSDITYQASLSISAGLPGLLLVADADGTTYSFPVTTSNTYGPASKIEDRNGNFVQIQTNGNGFTETDTAGRTVWSLSGFGASSGDTLTVSGLGSPYTVKWESASYNFSVPWTLIHDASQYQCTASPGPLTGSLPAVQSITLPNGKQVVFQYDPTYGLVSQITYPSGGWVKYTWGVNTTAAADLFPDIEGTPNQCIWEYGKVALASRTVSFDGVHTALTQTFQYSTTWRSFSILPPTWTSKQTTVTTTDAVRGASFTTTYVYSGLPSGEPLPLYINSNSIADTAVPVEQTVTYSDFNGQTLKTETKLWYNAEQLKSEQVSFNGGASSMKTYTYGSGGVLTEEDDFDFGASAASRKKIFKYQTFAATPLFSTPSIFDRPCQVLTQDGGGNGYAETDTFYDNGGTGTTCGTAGTPSVASAGGSTLTGHDETNYSPSSTSPRGNATTVIRQCFQGKTACPSGNPTSTYTYDETGQILSLTDPNKNLTQVSYADSYLSTNIGSYTTTAGAPPSGKVTNTFVTKITFPPTNGINHIESFTYGYNDGDLTTATDENGNVTTYRYNDNFDRPTETDDPLETGYSSGGQTEVRYNDAAPSPTVTTCHLISGTAGATCSATSPPTGWITTLATMDGVGHPVQSELVSDPDKPTYTATTYDGEERPYTKSNPYRSTSDPTYGITTYTNDALGRTTKAAEPDGSAVATSYSNNCTTVTDETGNARQSCVDGLGRMTKVLEDPGSSPHLNYETDYAYDPLDGMLSVTQNGSNSANARIRTFTYNSLAQLLTATNPESATTAYTYDLNGNVRTKVEPEANQTGGAQTTNTYAYDALNRVLSRSDTSPANADTLYQYDGVTLTGCGGPVPPGISGATNLIGSRSSMCSGFSASSFSYDAMGRLLTEAKKNQGSSAITKTVGYTYYLDGSLKTLTYPSGDVVTYTVGGAERLTAVNDSANNYVGFSGTPTSPTTYAPNGTLATMTQGQTSSFAGIVTSNTYNDRLQPILLSAAVSGGSSLLSLCYDFHLHQTVSSGPCSLSSYSTGDNGNVFQVINNNDTTRSAAYIYDPLNRIAQANTIATTGANCWSEVYTIDAWGNLTNRAGASGMGSCSTENLNATANTKNQLSILTYDAAGGVTNDGNGNQPTYDAAKELYTDAGFNYRYDADGVRIYKSSGSSGTLYWAGPSGNLTETDLTGTINEEYIYFNGARIARIDRPSGTVHYYFSDHLGSASAITSATGTGPTYYYYYPYGGLVATVGSDPNHYKFTGKERDSESNLDNFGARMFASATGRFMTPDWAARPTTVPYAVFGDPQSLNLYTYVRNSTLNSTDPTGHRDCSPGTMTGEPTPCSPDSKTPANCSNATCGDTIPPSPQENGNKPAKNTRAAKRRHIAHRILLGARALADAQLGQKKLGAGIAAGISSPGTGLLGLAGAVYFTWTGAGQAFQGAVEGAGAITDKTKEAEDISEKISARSTYAGLMVTLVTGDEKAGAKASSFEQIFTGALQGKGLEDAVDTLLSATDLVSPDTSETNTQANPQSQH